MNKKEMINNVIDLYDEIELLEKENESLSRYVMNQNDKCCDNTCEKPLKFIDNIMIKIGKNMLLEKVLYSWRTVNCKYDEETDTYKVTTYANWLKEKINRDSIPDEISLHEFRSYFGEELQAMYENEKTEALNEAKGIENVEEE